MKLAPLITLFLMVAAAVGQVSVPATEAAGAVTYKLRALNASGHTLQGKLIKLQFLCRSSIIENTPDGGVTGEVVDSASTRIKVDVAVPRQAAQWFMQLPTTYAGGSAFTVYARLSVGRFGQPVARLLGRQVRSDAAGSRIEW